MNASICNSRVFNPASVTVKVRFVPPMARVPFSINADGEVETWVFEPPVWVTLPPSVKVPPLRSIRPLNVGPDAMVSVPMVVVTPEPKLSRPLARTETLPVIWPLRFTWTMSLS